ncbi:Surfeit locus protein 4 [Thelohanellus kitauei]|uniref:Surfeit locus protein 4 n=1 Tax=Thelohanellus kitauei TaxID=669202 RepID=A0A0C2N766_THEKT|nr:Surfeit locus protein 4 [Thelohanellus kitauei]
MQFIQAHRDVFPPQKQLMERAEMFADSVVRKSRYILPYMAKFCILSTFFEDALRMWFQWPEQRDYFNHVWRCGVIFSNVLVFLNLFLQLIPGALVCVNKYATQSAYILLGTVVVQGIVYKVIFNLQYLMKSAAILGGLILLLASYREEMKSTMFATLPKIESAYSSPKSVLQLGGRVLIMLMFLTLFISEKEWGSLITWLRLFVSFGLMVCILVGYKTTLAGLAAAAWLMLSNLVHNSFWKYEPHTHHHDYYKFDFFQTMSVIGGLLLLVSIGPGSASVDERKKRW